jgi:salicylate hydroxylase
VELRTSSKVESFTQDAQGVKVRVAGGATLQGDALIAADGLWSRVREQSVGDGKPRVSGHIAYRAVLPLRDVPPHLYSPDVTLWGGEKTHLVHYPLRRGELFNLVAVFHSDRYEEGWNTFGDPDELQQRFALAAPPVRELLQKIDTWKMWVLCDREPVAHWSQGRATLLGDAAHPMLQYLAQGACMALEDAVTLGEALRVHDHDFARAFAHYQRSRVARTARVVLSAREMGRIYHAKDVERLVRNDLWKGRTPERFYDAVEWLYGWRVENCLAA